MLRKVGAFFVFASLSATSSPAAAADLPKVLTGPDNTLPACVTPGRLMAYLRMRNDELQPRYDGIATQYMRFGELYGVRWDFAFYQMLIETGSLTYWRGNRAGDVRPEQNNFAGLGATGNGVRGESFKDIETGVRAHLEHVLLYAGRPVDNPVAERTRKVREWRVLDDWQKRLKEPMTFADLASRWAPGNKSYARMLRSLAERFHDDVCGKPDPQPELVEEARRLIAKDRGETKTADATPPLSPGEKLAQQAIEQGEADGVDKRSGLGVRPASMAASASQPASTSAPYKVLDPPPAPDKEQPGTAGPTNAAPDTGIGATPKAGSAGSARTVLAGAAAGAKALSETAAEPAAKQKCRVWTASYGGQKSVIIRSVADQVVNFTVLDVNEGSEKRETQAFIAAYANNGEVAGEFPNQAQALDRAFELCPED